jgi:hypothetical protein
MFSISLNYNKDKLISHNYNSCNKVKDINEKYIDEDIEDIQAALIYHINEVIVTNGFIKEVNFLYRACRETPFADYIDEFFDIIEYLPRLLEKINSDEYNEFFNNFDESISLKFKKEGKLLRITCEHFYSATYPEQIGKEEVITVQEYMDSLFKLFKGFIEITEIVCPLTYQHPALQEWIKTTHEVFNLT